MLDKKKTLLQNEYTTVLIGGFDNDMLTCWKNIGYNVDISKVKVCPVNSGFLCASYITEKQD